MGSRCFLFSRQRSKRSWTVSRVGRFSSVLAGNIGGPPQSLSDCSPIVPHLGGSFHAGVPETHSFHVVLVGWHTQKSHRVHSGENQYDCRIEAPVLYGNLDASLDASINRINDWVSFHALHSCTLTKSSTGAGTFSDPLQRLVGRDCSFDQSQLCTFLKVT